MQYRAAGGSIIVPSGKLYKPGCEVPVEDLPDGRVEELLQWGFLEEIGAEPEPKPESTPPVVVGKWRVDPALTEGKDLDELNLMALEIDPTIEPFETVEEVRAQLSEDYIVEDD